MSTFAPSLLPTKLPFLLHYYSIIFQQCSSRDNMTRHMGRNSNVSNTNNHRMRRPLRRSHRTAAARAATVTTAALCWCAFSSSSTKQRFGTAMAYRVSSFAAPPSRPAYQASTVGSRSIAALRPSRGRGLRLPYTTTSLGLSPIAKEDEERITDEAVAGTSSQVSPLKDDEGDDLVVVRVDADILPVDDTTTAVTNGEYEPRNGHEVDDDDGQQQTLLQKLVDKIGKVDESRIVSSREYNSGEVPSLYR